VLALLLIVYGAGVIAAAFLCGFLRVRIEGMPVGAYALFWPLVLPLWVLDTIAIALARFGGRLRGEERK
jgi:hypothetical protein